MSTRGWLAWAGLVTVLALTITNPLALGLVVLGVAAVGIIAPAHAPAGPLRPFLAGGLAIVVLSGGVALVNGTPGRDVVFTVPGPDAPAWLGGLRFGGPVTREGLVAAGTRALGLVAIFGAFAVVTTTVSPARLLRATPAAVFQAGLVVTIGLSLLPATLEDMRRLREAEALRGRVIRWWRLPTLVTPAVLSGLDRAVRLAEAMEVRGFGGGRPGGRAFVAGALATPLLLAAAYFWVAGMPLVAAGCAVPGAAGLAWWMLDAGRRNRTTSLSAEARAWTGAAGACIALAVAAVVLAARDTSWLALAYNPFADSAAPPFTPAAAAVGLAAAWPFAVLMTARPVPPLDREAGM